MEKYVFFRMRNIHPVALAIFGWLMFVGGQIVNPMWLKIVMLSAARVLP